MTRLEELWKELGDVPIDESGCIDTSWYMFPKGTPREDIWYWFEDTFEISVGALMDNSGKEYFWCPVCQQEIRVDGVEITSFHDHGKCWSCHHEWMLGTQIEEDQRGEDN